MVGCFVCLSLTEKEQGSKSNEPLPDQTKPACFVDTYSLQNFTIAARETEYKARSGKGCHR